MGYFLPIVLTVLFFIGFTAYIIGIIRIWLHEKEINKIHKELERQIADIESKPVAMPVIEGRTAMARKRVQPRLDELERKRRFLLDKLPLIKR